MQIAVVGLDDEFVIEFSKILASKLKLEYVNFNAEFEKLLLNCDNKSLLALNNELTTKETALIRKFTQAKDVVISITNDAFISNENYKLFDNLITILIEKKETDKTLKNIEKLLKKHCKIAIKQERIDINEILNIIKG